METHEAGCACGSVRYKLIGKPYTSYLCHCTRCQARTGSAFGMSMHVPAESLEIIQGKPIDANRKSGGSLFQYCEKCRTLLFLKPSPDVTCIFPGGFDDKSWFKPVANVWVRSAQPWVFIDPSLKTYQQQPESWLELWGLS
jgi:hypothetical protein